MAEWTVSDDWIAVFNERRSMAEGGMAAAALAVSEEMPLCVAVSLTEAPTGTGPHVCFEVHQTGSVRAIAPPPQPDHVTVTAPLSALAKLTTATVNELVGDLHSIASQLNVDANPAQMGQILSLIARSG